MIQLMVNFKSYYKTKPKEPLVQPTPTEPKRPTPLPRAPSIKIKASGTPRPSISGPSDGQSINATPVSRHPSISVHRSVDTPTSSSAKRPRSDKEGSAPPLAKRPKTQSPALTIGPDGQRRKSKIVTLKTSNPKRLAVVLGQTSKQTGSPRTSLPGIPKKESSPEGIKDSIVAKPIRKPLPTGGDAVRKPLPKAGAAMSPPPAPPKMTINTNAGPAPGAGSPAPATPGSASTGRPKIKIIRKSQSGPSQSPPAP